MVTLQWGTTIGYDILVFDKKGSVAFIEVKSTASYAKRWILQAKYAHPERDAIPAQSRFVCCVDMCSSEFDPVVYVFPVATIAEGLRYFYSSNFSKSSSFMLPLNSRPRGRTKDYASLTVSEHIDAEKYIEAYELLGVSAVRR